LLPDDWCVGIGDSLANIDKVAVCSERDARLIAAAPDLLNALMRLIATGLDQRTHHEFMSDPTHYARAAIAKATGESHEPARAPSHQSCV
jgi:hypothetical protein